MTDAASIIRAKLSNFPDHGARDGAAVYKITGAELGTILDELTRDEGRRAVEPILANVSDEDLRALASTHDVGKCRAVLRTVLTSALAAAPSPPVADKPGAGEPVAYRARLNPGDPNTPWSYSDGKPYWVSRRPADKVEVQALYAHPSTGDGKPDREFVRQVARLEHTGDDGWTPPDDDLDAQNALDGLIAKARDLLALPAGGEKSEGGSSRGSGHDLCGSRDGLTEDATAPLTKTCGACGGTGLLSFGNGQYEACQCEGDA